MDDRDPALDPTLDHVSRRALIQRAGAGALAATALGAGQAAPQRALDDTSLVREQVTFTSGEQRVDAFLARPRSRGGRGAVIVVHEIFGVTDHIKDVACRLAQAGFIGIAVNYFSREGEPPPMSGGIQPIMQFVGKVSDAQVMADTAAAARYLKGRRDCTGKVGLVGFCWGGRNAMLASAHVPELSAAVAYYGRIRLAQPSENQPKGALDLAPQMKAPLLGHFGGKDNGIPVADVDALRAALAQHGRTATLHVYDEAGHAFNNDTRESHHPAAARLAWTRTLDWLTRYLK